MAGETERSAAVFRSPLPSQAVASFSIQSGSGTPQAASASRGSSFVVPPLRLAGRDHLVDVGIVNLRDPHDLRGLYPRMPGRE